MPDRQLLPIDEASEVFGISRRTLYRLIARGKLKPYKKPSDRRTYLDRRHLEKVRDVSVGAQ